MNEAILTGRTTLAGQQPREPWGAVTFFRKDFLQVENGDTIPVLYGTARLGGTGITPIWAMKSKQVPQQGK